MKLGVAGKQSVSHSVATGENVVGKLTMLTSDTMSMLAMSMLMPTSTGGPAKNKQQKTKKHDSVRRARKQQIGVHVARTPAGLTSKIRPQTDVIALQELVHGGLDV